MDDGLEPKKSVFAITVRGAPTWYSLKAKKTKCRVEGEMKGLLLTGIVALSAMLATACAPMPTLEELEAEALRTGDWTLVEQRERLIAKRKARRPVQCPAGMVSYCERYAGRLDCQCVTRTSFGDVIASR